MLTGHTIHAFVSYVKVYFDKDNMQVACKWMIHRAFGVQIRFRTARVQVMSKSLIIGIAYFQIIEYNLSIMTCKREDLVLLSADMRVIACARCHSAAQRHPSISMTSLTTLSM